MVIMLSQAEVKRLINLKFFYASQNDWEMVEQCTQKINEQIALKNAMRENYRQNMAGL